MKFFYVFYLRNPGFGTSWKCGISGSTGLWSRFGSYQNAFGPEYKEKWRHIWIGKENHIKLLEQKFKEHYTDQITGGDAGYSEWISGISEEELLKTVQFYRDEYFIKFVDVPDEFKPFTADLIPELKDWAERQTG